MDDIDLAIIAAWRAASPEMQKAVLDRLNQPQSLEEAPQPPFLPDRPDEELP
jgi:hypothetical protein